VGEAPVPDPPPPVIPELPPVPEPPPVPGFGISAPPEHAPTPTAPAPASTPTIRAENRIGRRWSNYAIFAPIAAPMSSRISASARAPQRRKPDTMVRPPDVCRGPPRRDSLAPMMELLVRLARAGGAGAKPGELCYSRPLCWLAVASLLVPTLAMLAVLVFLDDPLRPQDRVQAMEFVAIFCVLTGPLLLEFFRVRHSFDDAGLIFRSPWSKHRSIAWSDVASLRWNGFTKMLNLIGTGGHTFRVSPLLSGLAAFGDVAQARIGSAVLTASPDGRAVLQLMSAGKAGMLVINAAPPLRVLASIAPLSAAAIQRNG
jgi:hypothetical protein